MNTTVTGVFPNQRLAALAAEKLVHAGFPADQVEVVDVRERLIRTERKNEVDADIFLVSVTAAAERKPIVVDTLAESVGTRMVMTSIAV